MKREMLIILLGFIGMFGVGLGLCIVDTKIIGAMVLFVIAIICNMLVVTITLDGVEKQIMAKKLATMQRDK